MGLTSEAVILEKAEKGFYSKATAKIIAGNLRLWEKWSDLFGYENPILLGSKTGKWSGEAKDLTIMDWDGDAFQAFDVGKTNSMKSSRSTQFYMQLAHFYNKTILIFDRKGEHFENHLPLKPEYAQALKSLNLTPFGNENMQVDISPEFLGLDSGVLQFTLDLPDFYKLSKANSLDMIERIFSIEESETESKAEKYEAARETLEIVLNELQPTTFEHLVEDVRDYQMKIPANVRSNSITRKLRRAIAGGYVGAGKRFDFTKAFEEHKIINFVTSLDVPGNPELQLYEAFAQILAYELLVKKKINPLVIISDEHDLVVTPDARSSLLKDYYLKASKKYGWKGNTYYKIMQDFRNVHEGELKQSNAVFCTRLHEKDAQKLLWLNIDERVLARAQALWYEDTAINPVLMVSSTESHVFRQAPPFCQFHVRRTKKIVGG